MKRNSSSLHFAMPVHEKTAVLLLQCLLFHYIQGDASPAIHAGFPRSNTLQRFQLLQNYQSPYFTSSSKILPTQFHSRSLHKYSHPSASPQLSYQGATASPILSSPSNEKVVQDHIPPSPGYVSSSSNSPGTISSSFTLQHSAPYHQYFQQKSHFTPSPKLESKVPEVSYASNLQYPLAGTIKTTDTNNYVYSVQNRQNNALAKFLGIQTPAIFQQVQEFPEKSFTYQFNSDSSITPIRISKQDTPSLYNSNSNLVNNFNNGQISRRIGNGGISNVVLFPTAHPTARVFPIQQNQQSPQGNQQQPQPNLPFNFPPPGIPPQGNGNFPPPPFPQGPQGPPPPELENGYNPNHLQAFPEPPYESEFANLPPLERMDAAELEEYLRKRASDINSNKPQARRSPSSSSTVIFPSDEEYYEGSRARILNPASQPSPPPPPTAPPLAGLPAEEAARVVNEKPIPRQCAYNTITQGSQGEDCIGVKKK